MRASGGTDSGGTNRRPGPAPAPPPPPTHPHIHMGFRIDLQISPAKRFVMGRPKSRRPEATEPLRRPARARPANRRRAECDRPAPATRGAGLRAPGPPEAEAALCATETAPGSPAASRCGGGSRSLVLCWARFDVPSRTVPPRCPGRGALGGEAVLLPRLMNTAESSEIRVSGSGSDTGSLPPPPAGRRQTPPVTRRRCCAARSQVRGTAEWVADRYW